HPMRCDEVVSLWRQKAATDTGATDLGPITPPVPLEGGLVYCNTNCTLDLSRCGTRLALPVNAVDKGTDGVLQLDELRAASNVDAFGPAFDSLGQVTTDKVPNFTLARSAGNPNGGVNLGEIGPSSHPVFAFLRRMSRYRPNGIPAGSNSNIDPSVLFRDVW